MKCILVFDQLNDILFTKCDGEFLQHAHKKSRQQGLVNNTPCDQASTTNLLIQLFSPIVTSQRLMTNQFGNSYSYIQCDDGVNIVFREYMSYLFIYIGHENLQILNQGLSIFISLIKHVCGPNVPLLKTGRSLLLDNLFDVWRDLVTVDQSLLVEAVEQLMVSSELSSMALKSLQNGVNKITNVCGCNRVHGLIFVENKLLSLYSTKGAQDLSADDIMFIALLTKTHKCKETDFKLFSNVEQHKSETFFSNLVLLSGGRPHAIHIGCISDSIYLAFLSECGNDMLSSGFHDVFNAINALQGFQTQKDIDNVRHAFEFVDAGMKRLFEGLKKIKVKNVDTSGKNLHSKWDPLRKKYLEFLRNFEQSMLVRIESSTPVFTEVLMDLHRSTCLNDQLLVDKSTFEIAFQDVQQQLGNFNEFLKVKAMRNFTLNSRTSLSINKYLEEFPGLVHFLYIDRSNHRMTAPSLDFPSEDTAILTKRKIWFMVDFVKAHLLDGHLSIMWKDPTFCYSYFLWFEDASGSPLKPKISPARVMKQWSAPGILADDFYKRLVEGCFPKVAAKKVHCYELYCVHLGLAAASCVLEHSRRIAATIWEVNGVPSNLTDFL